MWKIILNEKEVLFTISINSSRYVFSKTTKNDLFILM